MNEQRNQKATSASNDDPSGDPKGIIKSRGQADRGSSEDSRRVWGRFRLPKIRPVPLLFILAGIPLLALSACDPPSDADLAGYSSEKLEKVAEGGTTEAQLLLGHRYRDGVETSQNYEKAARWYRLAAEAGDAAAEYNLGKLYFDGKGVPKDFKKAISWYRKAADQNFADAQVALGVMYRKGLGMRADLSAAAVLFLKAADQGNTKAQESLGSMYHHGRGVEKDLAESIRWYLLAAEGDNEAAIYSLGYIYEDLYVLGGRIQGIEKAMAWYGKGADMGIANCQVAMGLLYLNGTGVNTNYAEAMHWVKKAAEQGDASAQNVIGYIYHQGLGTSPNREEARFWYELAVAQELPEAIQNLAILDGEGDAPGFWLGLALTMGQTFMEDLASPGFTVEDYLESERVRY